ncbi:MAG: trypsin-like peptidase domain-containing protein, partial [Alphaproteobacteria bacterium]|nr:trypsin-like peptidase domain-containing protein [Alphaproteobacteria bacterium]
TTTGYGQIMEGEPNGENLLVERAFEDALVKFPEISCVNQTLSQRICAEDLEEQLAKLYLSENCEDCFAAEYAEELKSIEMLQECDETEKTVVQTTPVSCQGSACSSIMSLTEGGTSGSHSSLVESISEMVGGTRNTTITVSDECQMAEVVEECGEYDECHTVLEPEESINIADDIFVDIPLEVDTAEAIDIIEDGGTTALSNVVEQTPVIEIEQVGEDSFANVNNKFCIVNNPPFENLDPYNLYKLRASIVSVENSKGKKGAGLVIAENMVLTSADLITKENNRYNLETLNGKKFNASAFRVNPNKNVAVLMLDKPTDYQPLPMSLKLPEVNRDILLTLGMLDFDENGENYIDNEGRVVGYRWNDNKDAEIIVDTFVQTVTLGGALIDQRGNIIGISHKVKKDDTSPDLFIPIETALKALGLEICGQKTLIGEKPKAVRVYTPVADAIDNSKADKSPTPISSKERK